jgi:ABC-type glycerol-3-phosphate transport system permease component
MSAVAILATVPVFVITLIFQRQIVEGITSGVFK